jgi:hypothetical protein
MEKTIDFINFKENVNVENGILTFTNMSSINAGVKQIKDNLVTEIEGNMYKICYLGSDGYLKYQIKPYLRDDVCFNHFEKAVEKAGANWRTSASVLCLIDDIEFRFTDGTVRYGFNNIKEHGEHLFGLIPVDSELKIHIEYRLTFNEDDYEQIVTKEAV